jgi:prepilin-type N-terminal cleavage/methylation domain-containing protein
MKRAPRSGFTLIELLVVIAVIGILATLSVVATATYRNRAIMSRVEQETSTFQKASAIFFSKNQRYPDPSTASNVADACFGIDSGVWQKCCVSQGGCTYQGTSYDTLAADGDFAAAERAPRWLALLGTRAEAVMGRALPTFLTEAPTAANGFKGVFYDCLNAGCSGATLYFTISQDNCSFGEQHNGLDGVCEVGILTEN